MADTSTRIFRASLRGRLYRDIELPSSGSLEDLAAAIVSAFGFGFGFDHAFGFYSKPQGRLLPIRGALRAVRRPGRGR